MEGHKYFYASWETLVGDFLANLFLLKVSAPFYHSTDFLVETYFNKWKIITSIFG